MALPLHFLLCRLLLPLLSDCQCRPHHGYNQLLPTSPPVAISILRLLVTPTVRCRSLSFISLLFSPSFDCSLHCALIFGFFFFSSLPLSSLSQPSATRRSKPRSSDCWFVAKREGNLIVGKGQSRSGCFFRAVFSITSFAFLFARPVKLSSLFRWRRFHHLFTRTQP